MLASADTEDWIKPCEEEIEELEKLKSKMVTICMSPAGAVWLKGALEQRLEKDLKLMPMFRDALPND